MRGIRPPDLLRLPAGAGFGLSLVRPRPVRRLRVLPRQWLLAWLGLVSYSLYLLYPVLIEVYDSVPWTRNQNFVPTELLLVAVFLLVLLVCCGLTHRLIEAPMQRLGLRVTRRLDVRFGPDTVASQPDGVALRQRNETLVPVRSNALESRFHASGATVISLGSSWVPGWRGNAVLLAFLPHFKLAFRGIPGTIPPRAGTADRRVIPMPARSQARLGEAARPAAALRIGTLGVIRWLPNATDSLATDREILATVSYCSRWLAGAGATARGGRDDRHGHAHTRSVTDALDFPHYGILGVCPAQRLTKLPADALLWALIATNLYVQ